MSAHSRFLLRCRAQVLMAVAVGSLLAFSCPARGAPQRLPELTGATGWLNSPPLTRGALKGKVVLIDFWTYSCINCLRTLPYLRAWDQKYRAAGLVIVGVHSPEFDFEKNQANVERALRKFGITYPIAMDNNRAIWRAFNNEYWPAHYLIDATGRVRFQHFGEGNDQESERWIVQLLAERNGGRAPAAGTSRMEASGAEMPSNAANVASPETYIGSYRAERFAGVLTENGTGVYSPPKNLKLNHWGLAGRWTDQTQYAELNAAPGRIVYRFHARDLHLVLGPGSKPVRFRVRIDGREPGADHGVDCDAHGVGTVTEDRLYQLVRQQGPITDHTFEIEFLDSGVRAFAFTFG
jgi:thiol-disulfide isomerase/thioredoxin